jgi:hypothetical protein
VGAGRLLWFSGSDAAARHARRKAPVWQCWCFKSASRAT